MYHTPASYVIYVFGGVHKTARAIGRTAGAVSRWRAPINQNGCGGRIPSTVHMAILDIAKKKGLDITPNDFYYGRKVVAKNNKAKK